MNANDVIEAYVTDVAVQLPRKLRNDVALELRELLNEQLQGKAEDAGRAADAALATELVQAFGHPDVVAARYRPALTIIDPADGQGFLRWTVVGVAVIWVLGLLDCILHPTAPNSGALGVAGQWWFSVAIPSLWWPGMLVVGFALAARSRRRRPQGATWQPRDPDALQGGRATKALALVGVVCGVLLLMFPHWILDFFWGGRAAPAAYQALTYSETFLQLQAPLLLGLLLLNIPIFLAVIVKGHWTETMRRIETALSVVLCAAMAWTIFDGPIFLTTASDQTAKFCLAMILLAILVGAAIQRHRGVRPAPN